MTSPGQQIQSLQRCEALLEIGRYNDAATLAQQILTQAPTSAQAWCYYSRSKLNLNDATSALDAAKRALELSPSSTLAMRLLSVAHTHRGEYDEAIAASRSAVATEPFDWAGYAVLTGALLGAESAARLEEAFDAATQAVALAPHEPQAHLSLGHVLAARGDIADARAAFQKTLALDPMHIEAYNELARTDLRGRLQFKPAALARSANTFAYAVGADPREQIVRTNLDISIRVFFARLAAWFFISSAISAVAVWRGAELLAPVSLALPLSYGALFLARLTPSLRGFVLHTTARPWVGLNAATMLATTGLIVACPVAASVSGKLVAASLFTSIAALFTSFCAMVAVAQSPVPGTEGSVDSGPTVREALRQFFVALLALIGIFLLLLGILASIVARLLVARQIHANVAEWGIALGIVAVVLWLQLGRKDKANGPG